MCAINSLLLPPFLNILSMLSPRYEQLYLHSFAFGLASLYFSACQWPEDGGDTWTLWLGGACMAGVECGDGIGHGGTCLLWVQSTGEIIAVSKKHCRVTFPIEPSL